MAIFSAISKVSSKCNRPAAQFDELVLEEEREAAKKGASSK